MRRMPSVVFVSALAPWGIVAALWTAAFSLSVGASALWDDRGRADAGVAAEYRLLSVGRLALADYFFQKADLYFHRGIEGLAPPRLPGIVGQLDHSLRPVGHLHLEGGRVGEILPWLRLAVAMNPGEIQYSALAAYWLRTGVRRSDLAVELLREARRLNPFDYRIHLALADTLMRDRRYDEAIPPLNAAESLWPSSLDPTGEEALRDRFAMYLYRGHLNELLGRVEEAISDFREARSLSECNVAIEKRIEDLVAGRSDPAEARRAVETMSERHAEPACALEGCNQSH